MINISAMKKISWSIQKHSLMIDKMKEALSTLLISSLFLEMDTLSEFWTDFFHCVSFIKCYKLIWLIIRALLTLWSMCHEIYKNDINLDLYLSEDDICSECHHYCQSVQFTVWHLLEKMTMTLCSNDTTLFLNGFFNSAQWFIDEQGLDETFDVSNHNAPFQVQCDTCERRLNEKDKKWKYMNI